MDERPPRGSFLAYSTHHLIEGPPINSLVLHRFSSQPIFSNMCFKHFLDLGHHSHIELLGDGSVIR